MSAFARSYAIIRVVIRYRLDTLVRGKSVKHPINPILKLLGKLPDPEDSRGVRIRLALEALGPIFVKFGQILSTRPDLIPEDICTELQKLQDQVPPFASEEFIAIVEQSLRSPIGELFAEFDREPLASASVAQVHGAKLPNGEEVVVKVIRPGIDKVIGKDIALMLHIARFLERNVSGMRRFHPVEVVEDYRHTIFDELNLQHEAGNASLLRRNFDYTDILYVPEVHWPLTNEKVMVMERIYATPVTDMASLKACGTNLKLLAERGVEIFFTQVFQHNFFHADMHPGNIFVNTSDPQNPRYLAIDCAIMGSLTETEQYYLARNLIAIFRRDYRLVAELHIESGWIAEDTRVHEFAAAIRTVCEPIFQKPLSEISFGQILVSLFKTAQRYDMEVQPSLVLLQKTLLNIEGLGRQLYPELDLWETAQPYLEKWLRERYQPNALLDQLKKHGPGWLEQFPNLPQMIYQSLENLQRLEPFPVPKRRPKKGVPGKTSHSRWLGGLAVTAALVLSYPDWLAVDTATLILGCLGLWLLIRDPG